MKTPLPELDLLFRPRSIAIIGASNDLTRIGGLPIRFLRRHGYRGRIFPVNPKYEEIAGLPCYPHVENIPEPIDLALVGVPQRLVFDALSQCAGKKVPFVILFTAGYAEMGEEGRREQEALLAFSRQAGMRVIGPNCLGIVNTYDHVAASFASALEMDGLTVGDMGLVAQSGGIGNGLFARAMDRSIGVGFSISSGNEVDLEAADYVDYLVEDGRVRSIALFVESLKDPKKFARAADKAFQAGIPIVALKVGRSEKGRQAAASHTGAMSGSDALYDGYFRQKGICRVLDLDDLLEVANLFARYNPPPGNRVAILSSSGGTGALMADLVSDENLALPPPSPRTHEELHDLIPVISSIANPMDMTTQFIFDPEAVGRYIQVFDGDENFDALIFIFTVSAPEKSYAVAQRIASLWPTLRKPLVICWPVGNMAGKAFRCIEEAGIPLFYHPARCASAVGRFVHYGLLRKTP